MNAIEIDKLNVWFDTDDHRVDAVTAATLAVPLGGSFGLVGESGSGKSTILRALTGLVSTWNGSMRVNGDTLGKSETSISIDHFKWFFRIRMRHCIRGTLSIMC